MRWALVWALLLLTRLDGAPIWVTGEDIDVVTGGGATGSCKEGAGSVLIMSSGSVVCVREKPEDIVSKLGWKP